MKRALLTAVFALTLAAPVAADDKQALAEQYTQLPAVQEMMDDLFSVASMRDQLKSAIPPGQSIPEDKLQAMAELLSSEMQALRPRLEGHMTASAALTFEADELRALIDFYSSDLGRGIMGKMQPFMLYAMSAISRDMAQLNAELQPRLLEILGEE